MDSNKFASLSLNLAYVLFATFLATIFIEALPVRLLDPDWIIALSATTVNAVIVPLLGLGLVHLAAIFSAEAHFQLIQQRLGHWARWVSLGFFLLLPLLGLLVFLNGQTIEKTNAIQKYQIQLKASQLRKAVAEAQTVQQLQRSMLALQGPRIESADLNQPLPRAKQQVLGVVSQAQASFLSRQKGPYAKEYIPIFKQILRISLLSLIAGFGFAALAWNPRTNQSALTAWLEAFNSLALNRAGPRRAGIEWLHALQKRFELNSAQRDFRQQAQRRDREIVRQAATQQRQFERKQIEFVRMRRRIDQQRQK